MKAIKIPENQIYNAYLIEGEDMELLKSAAMEFTVQLLSRDPSSVDTGAMPIYQQRGYASCEEWADSVRKRVQNHEHPDMLEIVPNKPEEHPTIISVDNIRDHVTDTVAVRPYEAAYKVYLIEHAEMMNPQAQNAILKTLEEPPEYVVIMLLAANADAFLPTILSRVIEIKASERDVRERYAEMITEEWAQETVKLLSEIRFRTGREILDFCTHVSKDWKVPQGSLLGFLEIILRDVLCYKSTSQMELLYAQDSVNVIIRMASAMSYEKLGQATDDLERMLRDQTFNVNRDLMLENFLLRLRDTSI
ncbi:MAG: hypothetical protein MR754_04655 [Oribacterium sp.]|nr:hypothetical protein [Oribacterium sp.]